MKGPDQPFLPALYVSGLLGAAEGRPDGAGLSALPEESGSSLGAGLYQVSLDFAGAGDIEEQVRAVIRDAGYEPGTEVEYGVNWAYMQNRAEGLDPASALVLAAAALIVVVMGYLIISNIFQISITQDIRFYGLLKPWGLQGARSGG